MVCERGGKRFSYIQDFLKFLNHFFQQRFFFKRNYLKDSPFAIITVNDTYHNDEVNTDIPESDYFLSKKNPLFKFQIIKSPSNEKQSFLYENVEKSHFSNFFQNSFKSQCSSKPAFPRELGRFHWNSNHVINKSPWAAPKIFIKITYFFFSYAGQEVSSANRMKYVAWVPTLVNSLYPIMNRGWKPSLTSKQLS